MMRIAVLMACFNRREKTLACLAALKANALSSDHSVHVILADDGSTDGTAAADLGVQSTAISEGMFLIRWVMSGLPGVVRPWEEP